MRPILAAAAIAVAALLTGCSADAPAGTPNGAPTGGSSPGVAAAHLTATRVEVPAALRIGTLATPRTMLAPRGWTVSVWAHVDGARLETWAPDGRLLVSRPGRGDVLALTPHGSGKPGTATLVAGLTEPHGLAFSGSTLYVAESDRIDAYRYTDGSLSGRRTVIGGLPDDSATDLHGRYAHALKSVAVGLDGSLYFSIGSSANVEPADRSASPERATIMRIPPGGGPASVFARGVRNGTGLAVAPDGSAWTAVNDRDNTAYPFAKPYDGDSSDLGKVLTAYVNDHPEEMVAKLTAGRDLGWPYCDPDPDLHPGVLDTALSYSNRPFVRDVQTNAGGSKLDCTALPAVEQGLPAHSAPLGMSFTTGLPSYGAGALVAVHGSWNRHPPRAPDVTWLPWRNGTLQTPQVLLAGFQNADGSRWGRPVDAVRGPDGALFVSDDLAGAIYRVVPAG